MLVLAPFILKWVLTFGTYPSLKCAYCRGNRFTYDFLFKKLEDVHLKFKQTSYLSCSSFGFVEVFMRFLSCYHTLHLLKSPKKCSNYVHSPQGSWNRALYFLIHQIDMLINVNDKNFMTEIKVVSKLYSIDVAIYVILDRNRCGKWFIGCKIPLSLQLQTHLYKLCKFVSMHKIDLISITLNCNTTLWVIPLNGHTNEPI